MDVLEEFGIPIGSSVSLDGVTEVGYGVLLLTKFERIFVAEGWVSKCAVVNAELCESDVREGDVDADNWKQARKLLLLVVVYVFTIFQDLCYGLDNGDEKTKISSELLDIDDVEKDVCLGLLGKSAPIEEVFS